MVKSATLADGASVTATVNSLATAEGTYTVLTSDNLAIEGSLDASVDTPFIYNGAVTSDEDNVYLTLSRKTTGELGLTKSQASAWDAVYATAQNDDDITDSLLQVEDSATLRDQVGGLLPDHAGGVFKAVTTADRLAARHISDDTTLFDISDIGGWFEPIYWRASMDATGTAGYKANGWGLSGGVERHTDLGNFGVSYAWMQGTVKNNGGTGKLDIGQHDLGLFWRTQDGPLLAWARIGASRISIDSTRTYTGTIDDTDFSYSADGSWKGWLFSGLVAPRIVSTCRAASASSPSWSWSRCG
ncbi:autotransporter outer membrane beta-barrel domain-containing protein [Novosphingobium resinovorum]